MKIRKSDFDSGSPFSSWLKERIIGEIANYENGFGSELIDKHHVHVDDNLESYILESVTRFEDYPVEIQNMASEIIQKELDDTFKI